MVRRRAERRRASSRVVTLAKRAAIAADVELQLIEAREEIAKVHGRLAELQIGSTDAGCRELRPAAATEKIGAASELINHAASATATPYMTTPQLKMALAQNGIDAPKGAPREGRRELERNRSNDGTCLMT